jgi:hypothetical protein
LELSELGLSQSKVVSSVLELPLELVAVLLGSEGASFPTLAAEGKIATANPFLVEQAFAGGGLGLPLVATADEFGDEDTRWREEVGSCRRLETFHVALLVLVRRNPSRMTSLGSVSCVKTNFRSR